MSACTEWPVSIYRSTVEVDGLNPDEEGVEKRFYGNGVDDALFYIAGGKIFLAFDREAWNEDAAIQSARVILWSAAVE
jgi:hypothetical protein